MNVIATWSGGKDSCLATYKAIQAGHAVTFLANTVSKQYKRVGFHGVEATLINAQAEAVGIQLLQQETTPNRYWHDFSANLQKKKRDVEGVIFGDIFLEECFTSSQGVCNNLGLTLIEPLWKQFSEKLLEEFVELGFEAIVVSAQEKLFDKEWVGRAIDQSFIADLKKRKDIDPCGENGEYHSLVLDGPLFKKKINITKSEPILRDGYWFLDIQQYTVS
jgi:uncharacterized protein (TIGR00290 family)